MFILLVPLFSPYAIAICRAVRLLERCIFFWTLIEEGRGGRVRRGDAALGQTDQLDRDSKQRQN